MRLLFDTHILLWTLGEPARLTGAARDLIEDPSNEILFSIASIWEIAIKAGLDRPDFRADPLLVVEGALAIGMQQMPLTMPAIYRVAELPRYHKDPIDRLLVAQAMTDPACLLTADPGPSGPRNEGGWIGRQPT